MASLSMQLNLKDHVQGLKNAPVTLVEYGDYEHPRCGKAQNCVKEILTDLGDEIRFVFRHFPLIQLHSNALHAAFAAEAAGMQGKYWEMHDLLFQHQDALEDQELIGYAADAGVELEQFIGDMASIDVRLKVRSDVENGIRSRVNGTPSFYINGRLQDHGNYDYLVLRSALEHTLMGDSLRPAYA